MKHKKLHFLHELSEQLRHWAGACYCWGVVVRQFLSLLRPNHFLYSFPSFVLTLSYTCLHPGGFVIAGRPHCTWRLTSIIRSPDGEHPRVVEVMGPRWELGRKVDCVSNGSQNVRLLILKDTCRRFYLRRCHCETNFWRTVFPDSPDALDLIFCPEIVPENLNHMRPLEIIRRWHTTVCSDNNYLIVLYIITKQIRSIHREAMATNESLTLLTSILDLFRWVICGQVFKIDSFRDLD